MSFVSYEASAGQSEYAIPFNYLRQNHLAVAKNGTDYNATDWTISGGNVVLNPAVAGAVLEDDLISITRSTPSTALFASFANPSSVRASEINAVATQLLYILQENLSTVQQAMTTDGADIFWDGEGKELKNLAGPSEASSAATRAYVTNQIAASGSFPEPTSAQEGLGLRVVEDGGEYELQYAGIDGAFAVLRVPQQGSGPAGFNLGYELTKKNGAPPSDWSGTEIPLEVQKTYGTPAGGTINIIGGNDDTIQLPPGSWEILVEGTARSLTNSATDVNRQGVAASIRSDNLSTEYDVVRRVQLGYGGAAPSPEQGSGFVRMRAYIDAASTTTIHVCVAGIPGGSDEDVVIDYPFRVIVKEILL